MKKLILTVVTFFTALNVNAYVTKNDLLKCQLRMEYDDRMAAIYVDVGAINNMSSSYTSVTFENKIYSMSTSGVRAFSSPRALARDVEKNKIYLELVDLSNPVDAADILHGKVVLTLDLNDVIKKINSGDDVIVNERSKSVKVGKDKSVYIDCMSVDLRTALIEVANDATVFLDQRRLRDKDLVQSHKMLDSVKFLMEH